MTLWTVACQAPLSMGFSWQEYWSGLPCPPPGDPGRSRLRECGRHDWRLAGLSPALAFPLDLGARRLCRRLRGRGYVGRVWPRCSGISKVSDCIWGAGWGLRASSSGSFCFLTHGELRSHPKVSLLASFASRTPETKLNHMGLGKSRE